MSNNAKQIILKYLLQYLKTKKIFHKKCGKITMIKCPFCNKEPFTANILPYSNIVKCLPCEKTYNLIDIVKEIEFKNKNVSEEEIIHHLKMYLQLNIITELDEIKINEYLDFYVKQGFDLVPIVKGKKLPAEKNWTNKSHKDKEEWIKWINDGLNIGIKTGKKSNILILDIDQKPVPKELEKLLGNTLVQESTKGFHYFYKFDKEIPKTRIDEFKIDVESEGGQVVIYPSVIQGVQRRIGELCEIKTMSPELKKFIKEKITVPRKTDSEQIREDIVTESFNMGVKAEGKRNSSLIKLGGIIRKHLNTKDTEKMLHIINNHVFNNPLPFKEITAMANELDKYIKIDNQELAHEILQYLKEVESSTKNDIELAVLGGFTSGEKKKVVNSTLNYLQRENKITRRGQYYKALKSMEWNDSILDAGENVKFKIPYLNDVAFFQWEDLVVIGSQNKFGKTTLAMNIIKRLVEQKIKPYYIYNETGARFAKTALKLGMKDGDFNHVFVTDPEEAIFEHNSVIIFDWVKPTDFARTDNVFAKLVEKAKKTHSFLICFVQLKTDNEFFAKNMIGQFPALLCRYLYEKEDEGTYTKFQIDAMRDPKIMNSKKTFVIPCMYEWNTKEVKTIEEIKEGQPDE